MSNELGCLPQALVLISAAIGSGFIVTVTLSAGPSNGEFQALKIAVFVPISAVTLALMTVAFGSPMLAEEFLLRWTGRSATAIEKAVVSPRFWKWGGATFGMGVEAQLAALIFGGR